MGYKHLILEELVYYVHKKKKIRMGREKDNATSYFK